MNILIKTVASADFAAIMLRKWMDVNERSFCLFSTSLSFPILLPTKPRLYSHESNGYILYVGFTLVKSLLKITIILHF